MHRNDSPSHVALTSTQTRTDGTTQASHSECRDILLQGFHWDSHRGSIENGKGSNWYRIIKDNAGAIQAAGFTWFWFPPCSDSLAPQGYIPRRWDRLDTAFGNGADLRAAIAALGPVKAMADIVLNHRVGAHTGGADFEEPPFPDNRAAICRDDESGIGTGNHDTGERHPCGRDLDHTNHGVRESVKRYLEMLKSVGFRGWRYDLVKGFHGRYVGEYNEASRPEFAVGEFFDTDRQKVCHWIDAAKGTACAFDFSTRYLLYEATLKDDYSALRSNNFGRNVAGGLIGYWPARAVTFVDNHDTEYRREKEHQANYDSTRHFPGARADMAYAYTLTHPGVPCVFWSHYFDFGARTREKLDGLLRVRRECGLHAESALDIREANDGLYAAFVGGRVAMKLGSRDWTPGHGWHLRVWGDKFAVWTR